MSDETRGHTIKARRLALGFKSVREFAEAAKIDREALGKAEKGLGSTATIERAEAWLDRFEEESGHDESPTEPQMIEFEVSGDFGVRVVVKGPVGSAAELEASVARLVREMRNEAS